MRILVDPNNPVVHFHLTPFDMGDGTAYINDFLLFLQHGPESLRQKVLAHNGIVSINLERANIFSQNTLMAITFQSRDKMTSYLKGEITDSNQTDMLRPQLKEFFDERDKVHAPPG